MLPQRMDILDHKELFKKHNSWPVLKLYAWGKCDFSVFDISIIWLVYLIIVCPWLLFLTRLVFFSQEECQNYIRVLLVNGDRLFTCGTNAFTPICTNRTVSKMLFFFKHIHNSLTYNTSTHSGLSAFSILKEKKNEGLKNEDFFSSMSANNQ